MLSHDPDFAHFRDHVELTRNGLQLFEKSCAVFFRERVVANGDIGKFLPSKRIRPEGRDLADWGDETIKNASV